MDERPWAAAKEAGNVVLALIRHGQTAWNAEGRFLGLTDIPLDKTGLSQADALGKALPSDFTSVYCSSLSRAQQTALALHPSPCEIEALRELSQGELEGLKVADAIDRYSTFFADWARDPTHALVPGGETLGACRDRAMGAIMEVLSRHTEGDVIGVVTHQLVIASVVCTVRSKPLGEFRRHTVQNTALTALAWNGSSFEVVVENYRAF